jgi:hypothetical protein
MHQIRSVKTGDVIFEGRFRSFIACLEQTVREKINLRHADLRNKNLMNANLDDAQLTGADFNGANLTGANLSESMLENACFQNAVLYNTCFAYSNLRRCDFNGTSFGATDITGCDISFSRFSTLSCFTLDFMAAKNMMDCAFIFPCSTFSRMSRPPVVIKGLQASPIVFMDTHIKTGDSIIAEAHIIDSLKTRLLRA